MTHAIRRSGLVLLVVGVFLARPVPAQDLRKDTQERNQFLKEVAGSRSAALKEYQSLLRSIIPDHDITFGPHRPETIDKRPKEHKLTDEEKKIIKALHTVTTLQVKDKPLKDVIEGLKQKSGVTIIVDPNALEDVNVAYKSTVTANLTKVTLRTALKSVLGELSLTYVLKADAIQITTRAYAKETLTVRSYYIGDQFLVTDVHEPYFVSYLKACRAVESLVPLITKTVEPESWEVNGKGGLGTITFYAPTMSLVIKQTAEMHYLLGLEFR
jgi:hypothetical protein